MQSTARNFCIALALAAVSAGGAWIALAQAQTTIDVTKITCEQYLSFKVADPRDISVWLSGYFHGRQGDARFYPQQFSENFSKLKNECFSTANTKRSVVELAESLFGQSM